MKLSPRHIGGFLRDPDPRVRAVLVYGPDGGLVRERAAALIATVVEDTGDPFRVADVSGSDLKDDPARLADEAAALSLTGGRRAVRVRDAAQAPVELYQGFLESAPGDALVVLEAGELRPQSALRRLFERFDTAAALPCYADDAETLDDLITATLAKDGLAIDHEARAYLVEHLGSDRLVSRGELEKLALYMGAARGAGARVTLEDAMACVGDSAALSLDDVAFAAAGGDQTALARGLARSLLEGNTPVAVLRAAARHLQRLHLASGLRDGGASADAAIRALRPPVFFKHTGPFKEQLRAWRTERLADALDIVLEAERACKSTGMPQEVVCGRALMRVAAARGRQRPRS